MSLVLVTNVNQYAGSGAVEALVADGRTVACTDASFSDAEARSAYDERQSGRYAIAAQTPETIHREITERFGLPDAIVSNDVYPITRNLIEDIPPEDLFATFQAIVWLPSDSRNYSCRP